MRPQAGVGKLKHARPLQTHDLQWWGMLQLANAPIFSHLLTVAAPMCLHPVRERLSVSLRVSAAPPSQDGRSAGRGPPASSALLDKHDHGSHKKPTGELTPKLA